MFAHGVCRVAVIALGVSAVLLAAGCVWERLSSRTDARRVPAPGRLVDLGDGRRLHVLCKGDAPGPTVVLEMGLAEVSPFWSTCWSRRPLSASHTSAMPQKDSSATRRPSPLNAHRAPVPGPQGSGLRSVTVCPVASVRTTSRSAPVSPTPEPPGYTVVGFGARTVGFCENAKGKSAWDRFVIIRCRERSRRSR